MKNKLKHLIDIKEVISFDLFDTLITRNLDNPRDLFKIVQQVLEQRKIQLHDFYEKRSFSEMVLAKSGVPNKETTLQDIYDFMAEKFNINKEILNAAQKVELECEKNICEINKKVWRIYLYAKRAGKKIIITTDMYLPKTAVEDILKKNGINYEKLYLSNDINAKKSNGSLFTYILKDLHICPKEMLHIGDNRKSDYYMPKLKGIDAELIRNCLNNTIYDRKNVSLTYRFLLHFISNHINVEKNYFYKLGYQTLGPLLYGYSVWLEKNFQKNHYDKIFFLSRDGLVIQRAFSIVNGNRNTEYMYVSRQALLTPTLWMDKGLEETVKINQFSHHMSIQTFFIKMGLEPQKYREKIKEFGYVLEQYIDIYKELDKSSFQLLWKNIHDDVVANSRVDFINAIHYLKSINFQGRVAIVDTGLFGRMQFALERLVKAAGIDASVDGFYIGIHPESTIPEKINMYGYVCERNKNEEIAFQRRYFNCIFELAFMTDYGSVKRYGSSMPELFDYEYFGTDTVDKIKSIQEGALKFVKDYNTYGMSRYIVLDETTAMQNYLQFGNRPTREDVQRFSEIEFFDDEIKPFIPNHGLRYYLFHPYKFINELQNSLWVTGLLKSVLLIDMDYYKLANLMRKLRYLKSD